MILEKLFIPGREGWELGEGAVVSREPQAHEGAAGHAVLTAMAEAVALPAVAIGLSLWLRPNDPFFMASHYPWIWLAPVFVALRYGSLGSLVASLTLMAGWNFSAAYSVSTAVDLAGAGSHPASFPMAQFLGGFMTAFICGEFRDLWQAENRQLRKARGHLAQHLDALAGAHQVLVHSHERLTRDGIGQPVSLRDALEALPYPDGNALDANAGRALMDFLGRFFQLEAAALHLMEPAGLKAEPLAVLGDARRLDGTEELVAKSMNTLGLCHAADEPQGDGKTGPYLLAAPVMTGSGQVLAVLVVERMPFFAFQGEALRHLFAVLGYYADALESSRIAAPVRQLLPACPMAFAAELVRLHRIAATTGLMSALAARAFDGPEEMQSHAEVENGAHTPGRALECQWKHRTAEGRVLHFVLFPFCGESLAHRSRLHLWGAPERDWVRPLNAAGPAELLQAAWLEVAVVAAGHGPGKAAES